MFTEVDVTEVAVTEVDVTEVDVAEVIVTSDHIKRKIIYGYSGYSWPLHTERIISHIKVCFTKQKNEVVTRYLIKILRIKTEYKITDII